MENVLSQEERMPQEKTHLEKYHQLIDHQQNVILSVIEDNLKNKRREFRRKYYRYR